MTGPTLNQQRIMNVAGQHGVRTQWSTDDTVIAYVEFINIDTREEGVEEVEVSTVLELKIKALGYCCANC